MNYAIILAGGVGSRLWPLSRQSEPKQFLDICSGRSMIEDSLRRISGLIKRENIYLATGKVHKGRIKNCLRRFALPLKNILFEPEVKNTFAPIGVLSENINNIDPDAVIAVLSCDHFVKDNRKFLKLLRKGIEIAKQGSIVTLGLNPMRPETSYGYIRIKSEIKGQRSKIYNVDKFVEKPSLSRAKRFIKDKKYYWNSGIFIFKPQVMLEEIKILMPHVYRIIMKMRNKKSFIRLWRRLPAISIDYAIMEKTKKTVLLPADYTWIDVGSWRAIEGFARKDRGGNIFKGNCIDIGSKNIISWSDNRLLATLGLKNIIIVDTKDALLVCSKDKTQDVKKIVQILKRKNFKKQI